jgi:hypothetical protein
MMNSINRKVVVCAILGLFLNEGSKAAVQENPEPLVRETIGKVTFAVSESNKMIFLELPFKTEILLTENPSMDNKNRYTISIDGEWNQDLRRDEIKEIRKRYPGFSIAPESLVISVQECQIALKSGFKIDCSTPPATGVYFSAPLTMIPKSEGDRLKKELENKIYPDIHVKVSYREPKITASETVQLPIANICEKIRNASKNDELSFDTAIRKMTVEALANLKSTKNERIIGTSVRLMLDECFEKNMSALPASNLFSEFLSTKIRVKPSSVPFRKIRTEEIGWFDATKIAVLEISSKFSKGE